MQRRIGSKFAQCFDLRLIERFLAHGVLLEINVLKSFRKTTKNILCSLVYHVKLKSEVLCGIVRECSKMQF